MQPLEDKITSSEWEYQVVTFEYVSDCGGEGGWIISTINGVGVYELNVSQELPHFSPYLNEFGTEGWEVISIFGGEDFKLPSSMYIPYDYRNVTLRRKKEGEILAWQYLIIGFKERAGILYTKKINEAKGEEPIRWEELLPQMETKGWELSLGPYKFERGFLDQEAILKRPKIS